jgi:hypothetical protein
MKHKFSINGDARILIRKSDQLNYEYLTVELQRAFKQHNFNWENKTSITKIRNIKLRVPVTEAGEYDYAAQEAIAEARRKIDELKLLVVKELDKMLQIKVEID